MTWRDKIKVHPAADLFPMMSGEELESLADDIKRNGLRERVIMWRPSNRDEDRGECCLLDGRNRLTAMEMAGIDPFRGSRRIVAAKYALHVVGAYYALDPTTGERKTKPSPWRGQDSDGICVGDAYRFVVSANIHRRHLTSEQKRALIAELLKAQPGKSNRAIAKQAKADDKTVGSVRKQLERTAEIPQLRTRTGADGKSRPGCNPKPKLPTASEARVIARETGTLVAASDGNLYTGATKEETEAYRAKMIQASTLIEAIESLGADELVAVDWYAQCEGHWFIDFNRDSLTRARKFLDELDAAMERQFPPVGAVS